MNQGWGFSEYLHIDPDLDDGLRGVDAFAGCTNEGGRVIFRCWGGV